MITKLWQAELACTDGSIRNRLTLELPGDWPEGIARGVFYNGNHWCRFGEDFCPHVTFKEVSPEDRLPDVNLIGIRGDMSAREAGFRS